MLNSLAKLYFSQFKAQVNSWKKEPIEKQNQLLNKIVHLSQSTLIDATFNTSSIRNYTQFTSSLPVVEYEEFKPFIDKVLDYQPNILQKGHIHWFAKSSGTTADKSKFIPVNLLFLRQGHYKASKHLISTYITHFPDTKMLNGRSIIMGGSHAISSKHPKIRYGDLSAVLLRNASFMRNTYTAPPLKIALLSNWREKIKQMADYTLRKNITSISGVPTWTIAFMKYLIQRENKSSLMEIWQEFELYINGGVAFKPYKETMNQLIGKQINYLEVYNASEGFFAAQDHPDDTEGLLLYTDHGIFYEFIEINNYRKGNKTCIPLEGVKTETEYAMVVTNLSGLYRYVIGDTVCFTSTYPFKIRITGRIKQYINSAGEEVIVDNTDSAITYVCNQLQVSLIDYTVGPCFATDTKKGYHEWIISTEKPISTTRQKQFTQLLDKKIQSLNSDYEAKRDNDLGLNIPKIHFVGKFFFEQWLTRRKKLGGQHKVPRVANDRRYIEDMLPNIPSNNTNLT